MKVISKARAMGINFEALGRGVRRIQRMFEKSQDPDTQKLVGMVPDQYGPVYIGYDFTPERRRAETGNVQIHSKKF